MAMGIAFVEMQDKENYERIKKTNPATTTSTSTNSQILLSVLPIFPGNKTKPINKPRKQKYQHNK